MALRDNVTQCTTAINFPHIQFLLHNVLLLHKLYLFLVLGALDEALQDKVGLGVDGQTQQVPLTDG